MLIGAHTILFTADAEADRNLVRDVMKLPSVALGEDLGVRRAREGTR